MIEVRPGDLIEFDYINYKGIAGHRTVKVRGFRFGSNEFHPESQWLMEGYDMKKADNRVFAMRDMVNVEYW
jgi:hypothetical protein